jgi:hypothetical protein
MLGWINVGVSKFHDWKSRFGRVNEHNAWIPRDHWLTQEEHERIVVFARQNPLEGYRRLTFMMLDADVVACSPASVYRVLKKAGLEDARRLVTDFVDQYNHVRLHSAIGYVTPHDKLLGRDKEIHEARDRKLAEARERRRCQRQSQHEQREAARCDKAPAAPTATPIRPPSTSSPCAI